MLNSDQTFELNVNVQLDIPLRNKALKFVLFDKVDASSIFAYEKRDFKRFCDFFIKKETLRDQLQIKRL